MKEITEHPALKILEVRTEIFQQVGFALRKLVFIDLSNHYMTD